MRTFAREFSLATAIGKQRNLLGFSASSTKRGFVPLCPSDISPLAGGDSGRNFSGEAKIWLFLEVTV